MATHYSNSGICDVPSPIMAAYHLNYYFGQHQMRFDDITLTQIGLLHCDAKSYVPPHLHGNLWELTAAIDGEGTVTVNERKEKLVKNDVHLSCPFETHAINPDANNPLKFLFIAFNIDNANVEKELIKIQNTFKSSSRMIRDSNLIAQIEAAITEIKNEDAILHSALMHSILEQIILLTIRDYNKSAMTQKKVNKNDEFCYQIMSYINTHINDLESLTELGDVFNYNYFYISKLFKRCTGQTLFNYYSARRLDTARLMLEQGLSCTEIANALKYSSVYSFSKSFKQKFKISPQRYKNDKKPSK